MTGPQIGGNKLYEHQKGDKTKRRGIAVLICVSRVYEKRIEQEYQDMEGKNKLASM